MREKEREREGGREDTMERVQQEYTHCAEFVSCVHTVDKLEVFVATNRTRGVTTWIKCPPADISLNKQLSPVC